MGHSWDNYSWNNRLDSGSSFFDRATAPVIIGLIILAVIVGVGLWIYGKLKQTT
jgi:hypothetical protein